MNTKKRQWVFVVLVLLLSLGVFVVLRALRSGPEPEVRPGEAVVVQVVVAQEEAVRVVLHSQGEVRARKETVLVSEVAGRVLEVGKSFEAGGVFAEGEVLLRLDAVDRRAALAEALAVQARAELALAHEVAAAAQARRDWEALGAGEASALVLREPQLAEARASLGAAKAAVARARRDVERTVVRAPYAGRVRERRVGLGQYVTGPGVVLGELYGTDDLEVRLPLTEREVAWMAFADAGGEGGTPVRLWGLDDAEDAGWEGEVLRAEGVVDRGSRLVYVVVRVLGGGEDLRVGAFVRATLVGRELPGVFVLPRSALRGRDGVWVVDAGGRLRHRPVEVWRVERERVLVAGGLEAGERVCVSPLEFFVEGLSVVVDEGGLP